MNYLVDISRLSVDEKNSIYEVLSDWAFMVNQYSSNKTVVDGFVVFWDRSPEEFTRLITKYNNCAYVDASNWLLDSEHIAQAFRAAFDR